MMVRSFIPKDVNMYLSDMGHGNIFSVRTLIAQVQEYTSVK
jgi:hypothetical protein